VCAVAEYGVGAVLAPAKIYGFGLGRYELHRGEIAALVTSVAKGLATALAAGTPVVAFTGFDFHGIRALLGDLRFRHGESSLRCNAFIIVDPPWQSIWMELTGATSHSAHNRKKYAIYMGR
jgi:hypothetical protein